MSSTRLTRLAAGVGSVATTLALTALAPGASPASGSLPTTASSVTAAADGRVVFMDYATGQIYTANPDGSAMVQVTHLRNSAARAPRWSPDSTHIAYWGFSFATGEARLYEIKADGSGRHLVTTETSGYSDYTPDYTPDGQRIVFARCEPDPPGGCAVYSVDVDGTDRQAITRFGRGDATSFVFATRVSPDGQWVSFNRFGWRGITAQTWVVRPDGTDAHPVTKARMGAAGASWSPNSRVLYLQAGPPSGLGLHIFRSPAEGGHVRQLTFTDWPNGDYNPAISPSGAQIAFISDRTHPDLCCQDLYVMKVDGTSQRFIETGLTLPGSPDWGSAPLQSGPSVQVTPLTPDELAAGRARARAIEQTWTTRYGKVG